MKKLFTFFFVVYFLPGLTSLQAQHTISGIVKDGDNGKALSSVNVQIMTASIGTVTGRNGSFSIKVDELPATLLFSHIGYENKEIHISINVNRKLNVELLSKTHVLSPFAVYADRIVNLVKDKPLYVIDYEFASANTILLLAFRNRKARKPELILMNLEGDTLASKKVTKAEGLFRDVKDRICLVCKKEVYPILLRGKTIALKHPHDRKAYFENMNGVVENAGDLFYYEQYYYRNQVLQYYAYDQKKDETTNIRVIEDKRGIRMLYDVDRWGQFGLESEHHKRFEEMCFADPIFAPMFKLRDSLVILNYVDGRIEQYSLKGEQGFTCSIDFHNEKFCREEIIKDEASGKMYALFRRKGISSLREIDLKGGCLTHTYPIPGHIYVENIRVHNDVVYFLYRNHYLDTFQKLYKMPLG